jgi:pseudouridine-5'-phosphate glycosidase
VVPAEEVGDALAAGRPVVALESTIICHGMPYPQNVETARRVQQAVRDEGATPATVAVIDGQPLAGLGDEQIEYLGKHGEAITKVSRRDLPFLIARGQDGATTVAATMLLASLAGIRVFATGGIGGVHRGVEETMDVSADLTELGRTSVAVVCAGVKSVLDIPKTVEYLETIGVPIVGFRADTLPAFYARSSGIPVDYRADDPEEIARAMQAKWNMGLDGGMVIGVPVPESHALDRAAIDAVIDAALHEMHSLDIIGKDTTPFLLRRIAEETGGRSLEANIELVVNNARVAARIARAYAMLTRTG